jgi:hypothetical protein
MTEQRRFVALQHRRIDREPMPRSIAAVTNLK